MYISHFICSSVTGHLSFFHLLSVVNNSAVNMDMQIFQDLTLIFLDIGIARSKIAVSYSNPIFFFNILKNCHAVFFIAAALVYIPINSVHRSQFLHTFYFLLFLNSSDLDGYEVIFHCGFSLTFP
jgi:hypothetical protein